MFFRSAFKTLTSRPLAAAVLIVLMLAASAIELGRLLDRRHALGERTQANLDEAQAAADAHALVTQQGDAVRDLVLATAPEEIGQAERRVEGLLRRYDDAQDMLQARFATDPETTAAERALLAKVIREHLATIQPIERVVTLARHNEDASATRILVEEALPHETDLQRALVDLGALQSAQNRALAHGSDTRSLEMALMALLGVLASALALTAHRVVVRRAAARGVFAVPVAGLDRGRVACNDEVLPKLVVARPAARPGVRGNAPFAAGPLELSVEERARTLKPASQQGVAVTESVDES